MRNPDRIPIIINELEQIWKSNPDYRLGQLMCVFIRPKVPSTEIYTIEEEELLEGMRAFVNKERTDYEKNKIPYWERYPDVSKIHIEQITLELIESCIEALKLENNEIIISPRNLMKLNGAPIDDKSWMKKQNDRLEKIKYFLDKIEKKNMIIEIERGYKIKTCA